MQRAVSYFQAPQIGGASPQETEILAFGLCNDRLSRANTAQSRIAALHKTHQLWSLLVQDVGSESNALPDGLKGQIISIGVWAMRYSTQALAADLPLKPLIAVHQQMIAGLQAQVEGNPVSESILQEQNLTA